MTTPESSMNQVLRGRASAPAGQATATTPTDPLAEAKQIAAELGGQVDTLNRLLAKAAAASNNPFAPKEG